MGDNNNRLAKAQFVAGSLRGLIRIADEERMDMLSYLLEMALMEAIEMERRARTGE